jgi:hypothetical protein
VRGGSATANLQLDVWLKDDGHDTTTYNISLYIHMSVMTCNMIKYVI